MSTIKSSTEHLTLNADGAGKEIKFQANGVEKASIDSSGNFTSTSIDATKLSGALPAIDGSNLTNLPAGGKVLQVVSNTNDNQTSISTSTLTDVLILSITPSSSSSKILLMVDGQFSCSTDTYGSAYLYRDSTSIGESTEPGVGVNDTTCWQPINHRDGDGQWENELVSGTYLDSPNTTSTITYKLKYKKDYGSSIYFNRPLSGEDAPYHWNSVSTMTLMEIGA